MFGGQINLGQLEDIGSGLFLRPVLRLQCEVFASLDQTWYDFVQRLRDGAK
jgi:hypothetical protein